MYVKRIDMVIVKSYVRIRFIIQGWDCSDFCQNSDFLCRPGEENQTIFFPTNKEILLIGLLL